MPAGDVTKQLIANVRARVGSPSRSGILDNQLLAYLNAAQENILIRVDNEPLTSVTKTATGNLAAASEPCHTGAMFVALPSGFVREVVVLYKDIQAKCTEVSLLDQLDWPGHTKPSTVNVYYYLWDGKLYVEAGTTAVAAYTLYYIAMPATLTLAVDPTISGEFFVMMEDFATARCREQMGQFDEKKRILTHYQNRSIVLNSRSGVPVYEGQPGNAERGV